MASVFGTKLKVSVFGQSHSEKIGVVIDGLPSGFEIDFERLDAYCARRKPGTSRFSTKRKESDTPEFVSGLVGNRTCGAPLCAVITNSDTRSKDYSQLAKLPRPSHADYAAFCRYGDAHDIRGGGHFSGRLTAPLCIAGAIAAQILEKQGISIGSHIRSIGSAEDEYFNPVAIEKSLLDELFAKEFPTLGDEAKAAMQTEISAALENADSVGGTVETAIIGLKPGIGEPIFDGIENRLAAAVFGVPAVKGIEFGAGFELAKMRGSEANDAFTVENGEIRTKTNNCGGILGGISSGMPIIFRTALKPTPSIGREQDTVNLETNTDDKLTIVGRHDPCIVHRAVAAIEAATAIAVLDLIL